MQKEGAERPKEKEHAEMCDEDVRRYRQAREIKSSFCATFLLGVPRLFDPFFLLEQAFFQ